MAHPMRRKDREITDPLQIDHILDEALFGYLALCDGDEPYVLPMNFVNHKGKIYFHCALEGHKLEVIRKNSAACFNAVINTEVVPSETARGWGMMYESALVRGEISFVEEEEEKREAMIAMLHKVAGPDYNVPVPSKDLADIEVLRLNPSERTAKARRPLQIPPK